MGLNLKPLFIINKKNKSNIQIDLQTLKTYPKSPIYILALCKMNVGVNPISHGGGGD